MFQLDTSSRIAKKLLVTEATVSVEIVPLVKELNADLH